MSFLSCPTEVRDMIYKPLLLASSAIIMFEEYLGDDGVTYDHGIAKGQYSTPPPELFALLLVNKTIHIGVWDCFFCSNDFALLPHYHDPWLMQQLATEFFLESAKGQWALSRIRCLELSVRTEYVQPGLHTCSSQQKMCDLFGAFPEARCPQLTSLTINLISYSPCLRPDLSRDKRLRVLLAVMKGRVSKKLIVCVTDRWGRLFDVCSAAERAEEVFMEVADVIMAKAVGEMKIKGQREQYYSCGKQYEVELTNQANEVKAVLRYMMSARD